VVWFSRQGRNTIEFARRRGVALIGVEGGHGDRL
jgi:hypothetical protein